MTRLRKIMLEELERRNYAQGTTRCYLRTVTDFARYSAALRTSWVPSIASPSTRFEGAYRRGAPPSVFQGAEASVSQPIGCTALIVAAKRQPSHRPSGDQDTDDLCAPTDVLAASLPTARFPRCLPLASTLGSHKRRPVKKTWQVTCDPYGRRLIYSSAGGCFSSPGPPAPTSRGLAVALRWQRERWR